MEKFESNSSLPFVKSDYPGNLTKNGRFTNAPWPDTNASLFKVMKWFITPNQQKQEKKQDKEIPEIIYNEHLFQTNEDVLCWLGHASFFIRIGGINLLIDPILGDIPLVKRLIPFPAPQDKITNINYLLLSHAHRDHFDIPSLSKIIPLNPIAQLLGPLRIERLVRKSGFANIAVQEAGWFQQFRTEKIKISFLPALHWNKRGMNDFNTILWGGFFIESEGLKIYFSGDTAYGSHFKEIKETMGKPDICLLPIGAYKPPYIMKLSHTSPEEAVQAFKDLEGKCFIPMHYGTYDLADEPIGEPLRIVRQKLCVEALRVLCPGELFYLKNF